MVEIALREVTLRKVADGHVKEYMALLDAGIELSEKKAVDATTPYMMLEDITSSLPVNEIAENFPMIETRVKQLSGSENFMKGKQIRLVLLRAFVEFMRRCSRINDNALRGRTLTLLSSAFPLSEKSGVNVRGVYNTANTTEFAKKDENAMEDGDVVPVDWNFYTTFWSLQYYLSRPYEAETLQVYETVSAAMEKVVDAFANTPVLVAGGDGSLDRTGHHFVKFLTEPALLRLQLGDAFFRRHILTQFLILLRHLHSVHKPDEAFLEAATVTSEANLTSKINKLLDAIVPNGEGFTAGVSKALYWEWHWVNWKNENCPSFERPPVPFEKAEQRKKRRRRSAPDKANAAKSSIIMAGPSEVDTSPMWTPSGEDARTQDLQTWRTRASSIDGLQSELRADQHEPDEDMKRKNSRPYVWKALRVLERNDLSLVRQIAEKKFDLEVIIQSNRPSVT
eukprot:Plantae.Rhodophyta-Purpureofilum_apyrenoidigerum.ctg45690.p1 GENE.Plantae.Rhodophyta-Purpureofilum_apyrenoidigerum.ctg45690~~Plantae.Rhodophyta-Purpureofilum_apyrenoidigerum.ctg45690.p1  ORF type:complete len:519 (+),score=115.98 Plantae.Rhodophyta-Purpureofilum_apyrenoidigerum.ctg45690:202-1557(+)